jgi:hypothetical protein
MDLGDMYFLNTWVHAFAVAGTYTATLTHILRYRATGAMIQWSYLIRVSPYAQYAEIEYTA